MPLEDKQTRRLVEREISKHAIDPSLLVVTVINKVCTFKGRVKPLQGTAGRNVDIRKEMQDIGDSILLFRGVQEVVIDVAFDA